ncbi:MAG: T9SS type A sorting domain-containing protein, partial [Bacteroidota bacterium]|nr:T9SS type A sorting domain-containing protein [Bacteroidota bacterium]
TSFLLMATASSGLAVSYTSSNTSVATVSGNVVRIIGPGTTTITASQAGNEEYLPASNVQKTFTVIATTGLKVLYLKDIQVYPNPVKKCLYVYLPDTRQKFLIKVNSLDGKTLYVNNSRNQFNEIDMGRYASGTYIVMVEASDGACTKKILKL